MRTHEYEMDKGYPDSHKGQTVTWNVPVTVDEAISGGFFKDAETLVRVAVAQLNIKRGHAVNKRVLDEKAPADQKTIAALSEYAATINYTEDLRERGKGTESKAAKKVIEKQRAALTEDRLAKLNPAGLDTMVEMGLLTVEERDAELARRKAAKNG